MKIYLFHKKGVWRLFLLCALALPVWAESPVENPQLNNLEDYLRVAALNNSQLQGAFEAWQAAGEQTAQARAWRDPKLTYSYYIREVETRVGPMEGNLSFMQLLPRFGEIKAKTSLADSKANAAQKKYEAIKLNLFWQVKDAYYEYGYLTAAIRIAKENLELIKHFEETARIKYRTSAANHPDVIRAQIATVKLQDSLQALQELQKPLAARLNALLNLPVDTVLSSPPEIVATQKRLDREAVIAALVAMNPELAALNWQIQAAQSEVELAKQRSWPDIGLGVNWTQIGAAKNHAVSDSGRDAASLMLTVNVPIWQGSYSAARRQAQAKLNRARHLKNEGTNQKIAAAVKLIYEIQDSQRKISLFGDTLINKAEELIDAAQSAYKTGNLDFLALIDAQRTLLEYQLGYKRASANYLQRVAQLEAMIGQELPGLDDSGNKKKQ